jgi:DNA repair exonuclease SbcCD ATPase subunit
VLTIHTVNPTGVGPYGFHETINLDSQGLIWLEGQNLDKGGSNGSGKTWLLNVIGLLLFGTCETQTGSEKLKDDAINDVWGHGCCARVVFTNRLQQLWRVTFTRKWKQDPPYENDSICWPYHGSDIYLERYDGTTWIDEREAEMPKTQTKLKGVVKCSYEQYLTATYLAQGKGRQFIQGSHAVRMGVMTDVTGIDIWDRAEKQYKVEADLYEKQVRDVELQLATLSGKISSVVLLSHEQITELQEKSNNLGDLLDSLETQSDVADKERLDVLDWLDKNQITPNPLPAQIRHLKDAIDSTKVKLLADERRVVQYPERSELAISLGHEWLNLKKEYEGLQGLTDDECLAVCPTCGQSLPEQVHQKAEEVIANAKQAYELAERRFTAARLLDAVKDGEFIAEARTSALAIVAHYEQLIQIKETASQLHVASQVDLQKTRNEKTLRITQINWELNKLASERTNSYSTLQSITQKLTDHEAKVKLLEQLNNQSLQLSEQLKDLILHRSEWAWLAKNTKLLKAYKLVSATERLNVLLSEALQNLDGAFQVWCKPWRPKPQALKKDEADWTPDDVANDFTIFVQEGEKKAVPLGLYSGGEISIIALAFLIAFWRLADEAGAGTNLLLLDEVFGALDARNSQIAAAFLETLKSSQKTVLVVSHAQVVDSIDFSQKWLVTKKDGISKLEKVA